LGGARLPDLVADLQAWLLGGCVIDLLGNKGADLQPASVRSFNLWLNLGTNEKLHRGFCDYLNTYYYVCTFKLENWH